jgi:hypothetical protein
MDEELRALSGGRPIQPMRIQRYLESKFGYALGEVYEAALELAKSMGSSRLAEKAYSLQEKFHLATPPGKKGWGVSGKLDLESPRRLAYSRKGKDP